MLEWMLELGTKRHGLARERERERGERERERERERDKRTSSQCFTKMRYQILTLSICADFVV